MATARALSAIGYTVKFIPRDNTRRSADIYLNDVIYEIKSPKGKNIAAVERNLK